MNHPLTHPYGPSDPELDLSFERNVAAPPGAIYRAWTEPERLKRWFAPEPWTTPHAEVDPRPGGVFRTVMRGPDGSEFDGPGCVLDAVPNERFVWTGALGPGFRPVPHRDDDLLFTAVIVLEPAGAGATRYRVVVLHPDAEARSRHEAMGFHEGWGTAADQMIATLDAD